MAKKTKTVLRKSAPVGNGHEADLRRWCIEQAMRWPLEGGYGNQMGAYGGNLPRVEADILGRAKRIYDWVRA